MKTCFLALASVLAVGCSVGNLDPNVDSQSGSAAAETGAAPQTIQASTNPLYDQLDAVLDVQKVDMKSSTVVHVLRVKTPTSQQDGGELFLSAMDTRQGGIFDLGYDAASTLTAVSSSSEVVTIAGSSYTDQGSAAFSTSFGINYDDGLIANVTGPAPDDASQDPSAPIEKATDEAIDELSELDSMQTGTTPSGTSVRLFEAMPEEFGATDHLLVHLGTGAASQTYDLGLSEVKLGDMTVLSDTTARIVGTSENDDGSSDSWVYTLSFTMDADGSAPTTIALMRLQ